MAIASKTDKRPVSRTSDKARWELPPPPGGAVPRPVTPPPMARAMAPVMAPAQPMAMARASHANVFDGQVDGRTIPDAGVDAELFSGMLDLRPDGSGILRSEYREGDRDAYISGSQVRRFKLRPGDLVEGPARKPKENERFWGLLRVDLINGKSVAEMQTRPEFNRLTPIYPNERLMLEIGAEPVANRIIDIVAPIGKGQRAMIVSPLKPVKRPF
jgi:transcription termination factor Rho